MLRRKNNKSKMMYESDMIINSMLDNDFSSNFRSIYKNIEKSFSPLSEMQMSSILNLESNNNKPEFGTINDYYIRKASYDRKNTDDTGKFETDKKYGVKTLLNTKSKMAYPFDKLGHINQHTENSKTPESKNNNIDDLKCTKNIAIDIDSHCEKNMKKIIDDFVNIPIEINNKISENPRCNKENEIEKEIKYINIDEKVPENSKNNKEKDNKLSDADNHKTIVKNLSDIENMMEKRKTNIKNDIKIIDNNDNNREDLTTMDSGITKNTNTEYFEDENKQTHQIPHMDRESKEEFVWPQLSIEDINTTFKVVGDLKEGAKLKIVENRYLAEDNSYIVSVSRYFTGQCKEKIMSFLNHLFNESKRTTEKLIEDIRCGIDVDNKVSELENLLSNMVIFLHRYDVMRNVYKSDTGTHAKLGVIRNKFFTFKGTLIRKLAIQQNHD